MRLVTVFKRVRTQTGNWESVEGFKGKFHGWGLEIWEQEPSSVSYSVAIVERYDGQIVTIMPHLVRFDDAKGGE